MSRRDEQDGTARRTGRWLLAGAGGGLSLAAGVVGASLILLTRPHSGWVVGALTSRTFLMCAAVLAVCGAAMGALAAVLWRAGRPHRASRGGEDGVAMIEFALALPFILMLALIMAQTSLLMVGNICVHYSAFCAARSATVQVPREYNDVEPRNVVNPDPDNSGKMNRIKLAAVWAVMPVSCGSDESPPGPALADDLTGFFSTQGAEAPRWVDDRLSLKLGYAADHTEIEMVPPAEPEGVKYKEHEDLHVTVRHTFYLSIPYASRLFAALPDGRELDFGEGEYGTVIEASCTLPNEGVQDYVDIEQFPR